jgi:hypothetical protein
MVLGCADLVSPPIALSLIADPTRPRTRCDIIRILVRVNKERGMPRPTLAILGDRGDDVNVLIRTCDYTSSSQFMPLFHAIESLLMHNRACSRSTAHGLI